MHVDLLKWLMLKTPSREDDDYEFVPFMRYGHTASVIGDKIYIYGGRHEEYGACNKLYCYDLSKFLICLYSIFFTVKLLSLSILALQVFI